MPFEYSMFSSLRAVALRRNRFANGRIIANSNPDVTTSTAAVGGLSTNADINIVTNINDTEIPVANATIAWHALVTCVFIND